MGSKYLMRLSDGVIFPYTDALAERKDKFEAVILNKLPKSGRVDVVSYHNRMRNMEREQREAAKKELKKAGSKKG